MATTQTDGQPFVICENMVRIYKVAELEVFALQGLDIEVHKGEFLAIVGASGSGKTTLLNVIGGLDRPSAGKAFVDEVDLLKQSDEALAQYRLEKVGFVWQQSSRNLLPYLTAQENVELPMRVAGMTSEPAGEYAGELLDTVGLSDWRKHRLEQLSGGQQQRVAIAVALANRPQLLLADEPTGEVDSATAAAIWQTLRHLNTQYGLTTIIVTHDPQIARVVDRVVGIRDGKVSTETTRQIGNSQPPSVWSEASRAASSEPVDTDQEEEEERYEEQSVLDSAGRLQIPREYLEQRGIRTRAKIELVEDGILIRPPDSDQVPKTASMEEAGLGDDIEQSDDSLSLYGGIEQDAPPEDLTSRPSRKSGRFMGRFFNTSKR